jgi:hypothetical protein
VTLQKLLPAVPTLREAEAAGNTLDVDVDQQLVGELAGSDSLLNVPLPYLPLPDIPLPNDLLPELLQDGSVGEQ